MQKKEWEDLWKNCQSKFPWMNRDIPPEIPQLISTGILPSKGAVLDIGCGGAEISYWFSKSQSYQVDAFDISEMALNLAKEKYHRSSINFFQHDITEKPLEKKYDILIDRGCLHTIQEDLLTSYATHIANACNSSAKFLIFMRAFRAGNKDKSDEKNRLKDNVNFFFGKQFKMDICQETSLSRETNNSDMPGLFFLLSKRAD